MSHSIDAPQRWEGPTAVAGQRGINVLPHAKSAAISAKPISNSRLDLAGHGAEIAVDASEQIDQDFPLVLSQAGEQAALALQRRDDNGVMGLPSLRRQRDRVAAAVARVGLDRDQVTVLHYGQGTAHRALVEADHVTDARGGNARLERPPRH